MREESALEGLFARYVEQHVLNGKRLSPEELCAGCEELLKPLRVRIETYHRIDETLDFSGALKEADKSGPESSPLPSFEGFHTVELLGRGGMGEVYKVRDLRLDRIVAAKVLRVESPVTVRFGNFLGEEARSMALFQDPRIVQIYEYRADAHPPVIFMEYVDGFDLRRVGPSLEYHQRARILMEVCQAVHHAHEQGIQHRDLKPENILVDQGLAPKILDFGLSTGESSSGHLVGTLAYLSPEQLSPEERIDARADIYALGVILYELLGGAHPYEGADDEEVVALIRRGRPPLLVEREPGVPEPLQAIALKAMETNPVNRYRSAREMALDLQRYLNGQPVLARPTIYESVLEGRILPHLSQIEEWRRLKLIYPHEEARIRNAYQRLQSRGEDWIMQSRVLSYSQISLYLGALLLLCGGVLYFAMHRRYEVVEGLWQPLLFLGIPFLGLNLAAWLLYQKERKAVAIAFLLAGVLLLPLLLLIVLQELGLWGLWTVEYPGSDQLMVRFELSNRQLQMALALSYGWCTLLAFQTRTVGLSSIASFLLTLFALAILTDFGLEKWIVHRHFDQLAFHLTPLLFLMAFVARWSDDSARPWLGRPLYEGAAILWLLILELVALEGKAFEYLGLSMTRFQSEEVKDPALLDTLTAMTLNGVIIYLTSWLMAERGSQLMKEASWLITVISPVAILQPVAYLVHTGEYSLRYDWVFLGLALGIALMSKYRQLRSFYVSGLLYTAVALYYISDHRKWFEFPPWAYTVIGAGLLVLALGFRLDWDERLGKQRGD